MLEIAIQNLARVVTILTSFNGMPKEIKLEMLLPKWLKEAVR